MILINLVFVTTFFAQNNVLTLEESLRMGLQNSKEIKMSETKLRVSEAKITEVGSQMLPRLTLGASYARLSNIPPFEVVVPFAPTPIKIQDPILNNYSLKLSLQQPLFTGFRLSSLKSSAELYNKASEIDYIKDINETAFNIQNTFWNYYRTQKALELINENLQSLQYHLEDTKNFMDNGLVTRNDFLKLQVQISMVELMKIETENNIEVAQAVFNKTVGLPLDSQTEIKPKEIVAELTPIEYKDYLNEALKNREELKSFNYRVEANKNSVRAANSGWFPSVFLFGNYYYSRPNQRILPSTDKFDDTWDVGISLSWDIWNWGYTSSQSTQAEQQLIQTQTAYDLLKESVEIEVYQNYLKLISENNKVTVNKRAVEQADENYRITNEKYNQQLATSTELIDAKTSLLDAQTKLLNATIDFEIAKIKLNKSVGRKIY